MRWQAVLGALALCAGSAPALAQGAMSEDEARRAIPHFDAMKAAADRGRRMYRYDQAAWHATDRFLEDWGQRPTDWLRGYFVEPGEGEQLATVFFGDDGGTLVEVARYRVEGGRVVDGGLLDADERPELSPLGKRIVEARRIAFEEAARQEYGLCNRSQPNTLILPPDENDAISVYLLTAPTETDSYPIGGHYRIDVAPDGTVASTRRFLNTCFAADWGEQQTEGGEPMNPTLITLSHLLDPQPTEIHAFASYYVPVALMLITTENERLWSLERGTVGYIGTLDEIRAQAD